MPLPPELVALLEARELVRLASIGAFRPSREAYLAAPSEWPVTVVPMSQIDPIVRGPGAPNFNKEDPERPGIDRTASILQAIRADTPLPPVLLYQRQGDTRYEVSNGHHRFSLSLALGFTSIPANAINYRFDGSQAGGVAASTS